MLIKFRFGTDYNHFEIITQYVLVVPEIIWILPPSS